MFGGSLVCTNTNVSAKSLNLRSETLILAPPFLQMQMYFVITMCHMDGWISGWMNGQMAEEMIGGMDGWMAI